MRLSSKFVDLFKEYFSGLVAEPFDLYLFGSRSDAEKKGGDIDLLFVSSDSNLVSKLKSQSSQIKVRLAALADDQKVDIIFCKPEELLSDPFLKSIKNKVKLN